MLEEGTEVEYNIYYDDRSGKNRASDVTGGIKDDDHCRDRHERSSRRDSRRSRSRSRRCLLRRSQSMKSLGLVTQAGLSA